MIRIETPQGNSSGETNVGIFVLLRSTALLLALTHSVVGCADQPVPVGPTERTESASSAVQVVFEAVVDGPAIKPTGCPEDAFICGTAAITGFGSAAYSFSLGSLQLVSESCGSYDADVTFTLEDGSSLTLGESGIVCGPGKSFFPVPAPGGSYGNPAGGNGIWNVITATGRFEGRTGSGTNTFQSAGASFHAIYTGLLES